MKAMTPKNQRLPRISKARLAEMIEQATVDAYNESEQITGWFTMIDENLAVPFETTVLGVKGRGSNTRLLVAPRLATLAALRKRRARPAWTRRRSTPFP